MKKLTEGCVVSAKIIGIGTKGDSIGKIEGGYVIIIPDQQGLIKGEFYDIELTKLYTKYAFGRLIDG